MTDNTQKMGKGETLINQGDFTPESIAETHQPAFVAAQMQAYRGSERPTATWTLRKCSVTYMDFENPLIPCDTWVSVWTKDSHFWIEQNPARCAVSPIDLSQLSSLAIRWSDVELWVIFWDTDMDDTVDTFDVLALSIRE